jgi:hypothetical protein
MTGASNNSPIKRLSRLQLHKDTLLDTVTICPATRKDRQKMSNVKIPVSCNVMLLDEQFHKFRKIVLPSPSMCSARHKMAKRHIQPDLYR